MRKGGEEDASDLTPGPFPKGKGSWVEMGALGDNATFGVAAPSPATRFARRRPLPVCVRGQAAVAEEAI